MLKTPKFCGKLAFLAALIAILMFILNGYGTWEKAWQLIKSDLIAENAELKHELENALKLHKRLIRDVRLFHDEIQLFKLLTEAPSLVGTSLTWPPKRLFFFSFPYRNLCNPIPR